MKKTDFQKRIEDQQKFLEKIYKDYFINKNESTNSNKDDESEPDFGFLNK